MSKRSVETKNKALKEEKKKFADIKEMDDESLKEC